MYIDRLLLVFFFIYTQQKFSEETQDVLLVKNDEGYIREQGVADCDYLKAKDDNYNPPLVESERYQLYYKQFFYNKGNTI